MSQMIAGNIISQFYLPERASTVAGTTDAIFNFILALSVFFTALILILMVAFVIKYRHREGKPHDPSGGHSTALELTWTLIPTVLVVIIFYAGFKHYQDLMVEPPYAYEIAATGQMWAWSFTYPNGHEDPELHVPIDVPVRVVLNSKDVIHSLFIPAFRVKKDVVPGRYNHLWFQANKLGTYDIYCAGYCGTQHSSMLSHAVVHSGSEFKDWLAKRTDDDNNGPPVDTGKRLYKTKGCVTCHSVDGTRLVGPTWKDMYGSKQPLQDGTSVLADDDYIRESIALPQAKIVATFGPVSSMPAFALKDREMLSLIAYMKSISTNYTGDATLLNGPPETRPTTGPASQPAAGPQT